MNPTARTDLTRVHVTAAAADAVRIVRDDAQIARFDAILCVGGDGTVHEVINGLAARNDGMATLAKLPIGVIPTGNSTSAI
jgi:sphingosine kinase